MQFVRAYYFFLELSVCSNVASSVRQGQAKPDSSPHLRPKGLHSARGRINFGRYARLQRAISSITMEGVFVNTRCSLVPFEKSSIFPHLASVCPGMAGVTTSTAKTRPCVTIPLSSLSSFNNRLQGGMPASAVPLTRLRRR